MTGLGVEDIFSVDSVAFSLYLVGSCNAVRARMLLAVFLHCVSGDSRRRVVEFHNSTSKVLSSAGKSGSLFEDLVGVLGFCSLEANASFEVVSGMETLSSSNCGKDRIFPISEA